MHPGTSLTDAMREWATPAAGLANYMEPPETFAARSEALVAKGSRPLGVNLGQQAQGWPTPRSSDGDKGGPNQAQKGKPSLVALARGHQGLPTPTAGLESSPSGPTSRRLNPAFVEWLMGWPEGWSLPVVHSVSGSSPISTPSGSTGSDSSETASSRTKQQQRSRSSGFTSKGGSHE